MPQRKEIQRLAQLEASKAKDQQRGPKEQPRPSNQEPQQVQDHPQKTELVCKPTSESVAL